ncbi:Gfo/Idh/MocA family protein, partial [Nostoc commune]|uniref:Gfo/Idh/MocA family protein n=1 Tax=Nostoc commune TaxID=1178 RepID=UPI0018C5FD30
MMPLRIGIVGLGFEGNVHARQFNDTGLAQVVAVCDINEQCATQAANIHGATHIFSNYNEMLENSTLDAISIATPNHMHYPIAMAAINAGLHVFCEKPLALTL